MNLPKSAALTPRLIWSESTGSTNTDLVALANTEVLSDFTVLATANQTAGRGRAGRVWQAPAGASLAISVYLRPGPMPSEALGWLPLLAGLAMTEAVRDVLPEPAAAGVKWPNDVLIGERKVSGVLSELVSVGRATTENGENAENAGLAVVIGAGVNVTLAQADLPVETATSLAIAGAKLPANEAERLDLVLAGYLRRLAHWYQAFKAGSFDAEASGLRAAVIKNCLTLNREVRAVLPGGAEEIGWATSIDGAGQLVLQLSGGSFTVAAGDIVHLRHN
jgi:BirA family biotin operon repressor/biotin-[acetyl-CoA-carboxylase] ligase